jgi:hypothetical protein
MPFRAVLVAVEEAADEALRTSDDLYARHDPQTGQAASLYLQLRSLRHRLRVMAPRPTAASIVTDLELARTECRGALQSVEPLVDRALRVVPQE